MKQKEFRKRMFHVRVISGLAVTLAGILLIATHAPLILARPAQTSVMTTSHPDFSGFWEVVRGGGGRGGGQPAKVTPWAIAHAKKYADERAAGKVVVYASRWCNFYGVPFMMGQSPPINIVQGSNEMGIYSEQYSAPRYIYLDNRPHPDANSFTPTTNGHSTAHWEGDELVVDTTNFSAKGHPEVPSGGYRTPTSHLVERFKVSPEGNQLTIISTWDDPKVFLEAHSYSVTYRKLPQGTYAFEDFCDGSDPAPFVYSGGTSDPPDQDQ